MKNSDKGGCLSHINLISNFSHATLNQIKSMKFCTALTRGGSKTAATSKMEHFVITIITKRSMLDVAAALDPLLMTRKH